VPNSLPVKNSPEICPLLFLFKRLKVVSFMSPLTPNTATAVFLSGVSYLENKRQVLVEYSSEEEKFNERQAFFPKFFLPFGDFNRQALDDVFSLYDARRFRLEQGENSLKVTAKTFTDLKKLANIIHLSLDFKPLVLSPERQHLIESEISYFDAFIESPLGRVKAEEKMMPKISFDFLSEPLHQTISHLKKSDQETAVKLLDSVTYANILSVPVQEMPEKKPLLAELFLEKMFFKHAFAFNKPPLKEPASSEPKKWFKFYDEVIELDFSFVWPTLFTHPFHNIGVDTLNCDCCRPEKPVQENVSPSSQLEVEFLSGGLYVFNPSDPDWAEEMHETLVGREQRLAKKKEWCLDTLPIGPFSKQEKAFLPLQNALELFNEGKARLTGKEKLSWFCQKKESFLSKEISHLNDENNYLGAQITSIESKALKEFGMLSSRALAEDLDYFFACRFKEKLAELLTFIPNHLFSTKSKFHSPELSRSIKALQKQTLEAFKNFTVEEGSKFVHAHGSRAYVKSDSGLSLVQKFSQERLIPVPKVKGRRNGVFWR
jgi:hypothetical protein